MITQEMKVLNEFGKNHIDIHQIMTIQKDIDQI